MSFYDDASLIMYPSGYKANKIYSLKPTDGSGDLDFTRSNDTATRVNSAGLIEKVRTNVILQSNTFNTTWLATDATITSGASDPNGGTTAWTLANTAASGIIQQAVSLTGLRSVSIYAKQGTHRYLSMGAYGGTNSYQNFDLQDGVVSNGANGRIESVGNGWFRCTSFGADGTTGGVQIFPSNNSIGAGTTNGNILIWSSQLESGDIATDYIPTTTNAVSVGMTADIPRIDYTGGGCGKLLLEPQRTNIQLNSESFDNASWSKTNSAVLANQLASPDGYVNADKLNETAVNIIHQLESSRLVTSGSTYTMSVFAKKGERDFVRLYEDSYANSAYFNLNTGVLGTVSGPTASAKIEAIGSDGWYRCSVTYTETANNFARYRIAIAKQDDEVSYLGIAGSGIYVWGAQLEEGAYPTSYIPTLSAASTRGADAASKTGISSLINSVGTLFVDLKGQENGGPSRRITLSDGTNNNRVALELDEIASRIRAYIVGGGLVDGNVDADGFNQTQQHKVAIIYNGAALKLFIDGALITTLSTAVTASGMDRIQFNGALGGNSMYASINQLLVFKTALSDTDAIALTA